MDDQTPEKVEAVPHEAVQQPDMEMGEINSACFVLILAMLPMNAATLEVTQHSFQHGGEVLGDFKVTVQKLPATEGPHE